MNRGRSASILSPFIRDDPDSPWVGISNRRLRSESLGSHDDDDLAHPHLPRRSYSITHEGSGLLEKIHQDNRASSFDGRPPLDTKAASPGSASATPDKTTPPSIAILYGLINFFIVLPVLISFGNIIYHDAFFTPYLPLLIRLTMISGTIHQICFSTFSSLPFAVGQVQDAGLIFLSSMASSMVRLCRVESDEEGVQHDDAAILATVTIGLAMATAILGIALVLIGKFRLASYVQLLPTPVVGGYLAFIGFFCGQGGLSIMAGIEISGLQDWGPILSNRDVFLHVLPGLAGGISLYIAVRRIQNSAVLPCAITLMIAAFYTVLFVTGSTLDDARDGGWVPRDDSAPPPFSQTWSFLRLDKVVWSVLPYQIPTLLGMTIVVALSSSLDVAAIELELNQPLDYDREITTVGISNLASGLTGGYTGSYIFSQSIFSLRAGVTSRVAGFTIAVAEAVVVLLPFNLLVFVPHFFFGSLLIFIACDLIMEWLVEIRFKMTTPSYIVALGTFGSIMALGLELGILAGIGIYAVLSKLGFDMEALTSPIPLSAISENGELDATFK